MQLLAGVEEMQSLYGPYLLPEKLIQQIWARGDYDRTALCLADGRPLEVLSTGRWNGMAGPDFLGARIRVGGEILEGDVEIHAREAEWHAHGHADDPAYANVILHVVLFPSRVVTTAGFVGRPLPILELLPRLLRDLEDYSADAAVERLAGHPLSQAFDALRELPPDRLRSELRARARLRWLRKLERARARVTQMGWEGAVHATALEVLGYRFNRAPMLALAHAMPFHHWNGVRETQLRWMMEQTGGWVLQGLRPANQPKARLQQYAEWVQRRPDWPWRFTTIDLPASASEGESAGAWRRRVDFARWAEGVRRELTSDKLGGARWETWLGDGFLPFVVAAGRPEGGAWDVWRLGYAGDVPSSLQLLARRLGLIGGAGEPMRAEWVQGLLGWLAERERKRDEERRGSFEGAGT